MSELTLTAEYRIDTDWLFAPHWVSERFEREHHQVGIHGAIGGVVEKAQLLHALSGVQAEKPGELSAFFRWPTKSEVEVRQAVADRLHELRDCVQALELALALEVW